MPHIVRLLASRLAARLARFSLPRTTQCGHATTLLHRCLGLLLLASTDAFAFQNIEAPTFGPPSPPAPPAPPLSPAPPTTPFNCGPTGETPLSFSSETATIVHNNLGGHGPDNGPPHVFITDVSPGVNMYVKRRLPGGKYEVDPAFKARGVTLSPGGVLSIPVKPGTLANLKLSFYNSAGKKIELSSTSLTFLGIHSEQSSGQDLPYGLHDRLVVFGASAYRVRSPPHTDLST